MLSDISSDLYLELNVAVLLFGKLYMDHQLHAEVE